MLILRHIYFLDEPVISVERLLVHAGEELSAELICTVHGAPMPTVNWLKDNRNVPPSTNIRLEVNGHNHILRIQKVTDSDYGIYVCSAKNFKGKQDKSITLVRTPVAVKFIPPKDSGKDLSIIWEVESSSPITEHELRFRKVASVIAKDFQNIFILSVICLIFRVMLLGKWFSQN